MLHELHQGRVVGKQAREKAREDHRRPRGKEREQKTGTDHQPVAAPDAVESARPVVIADNGLYALGKARQGRRQKLQHALHDGEAAHVQVAPVDLQLPVHHDIDQALCGPHDERGEPQRKDLPRHRPVQPDVRHTDLQSGAFSAQKAHIPQRAHELRDDRGDGRSLHAPPEHKDENRIQDNIRHCAHRHRQHSGTGAPLHNDKRVQAQGQLHKQGPGQIDLQVRRRVGDRGVAGPEHIQKRPVEEIKQRHQGGGKHQEQPGAGAEDALRPVAVPLAQPDGRQRRARRAGKSGKRRDQHGDGKCQPHARQGGGPHPGNVPDVYAVHDIIQNIDHLRDDGGHRHGGHELSDAAAPHLFFFRLTC